MFWALKLFNRSIHSWLWFLESGKHPLYNTPNCLTLKTKQNPWCIRLNQDDSISCRRSNNVHCKALLLLFSNDCGYILLPNSDEFIGFLGILLPTQKETSIQTVSKLNWYYSIKISLNKSIPKFQCLDYHYH